MKLYMVPLTPNPAKVMLYIVESLAIIEYLEEKFPEGALLTETPEERGKARDAALQDPKINAEDLLDRRRELGPPPGVGGFLYDLALGGVGVHGLGDLSETDSRGDRQGQLADHVSGVGGDQGGAENLVGTLF